MKKKTTNTLPPEMMAARLSMWLRQMMDTMAKQMDESGWHPGMRYHQPRTDP